MNIQFAVSRSGGSVRNDRILQQIGKRLVNGICSLFVAVSALSIAASAQATLFTAYFSGTTTYYYDYTTNTYVSSNVGVSFSGWFTFDVANAEGTYSDADANHEYNEPFSFSGCQYIANGSCQPGYDYGTNAPVVTGYHIDASFGTTDPLATGSGLFDGSYEYLYRRFMGGADTASINMSCFANNISRRPPTRTTARCLPI